MKAVVQRVSNAQVTVGDTVISNIGPGLLVLLGVQDGDREKDADFLMDKIVRLRIFEDDKGKMNRSVKETGGELLVVSQFTLLGDCRKGRRPSFTRAAPPDEARRLYLYAADRAARAGVPTQTGKFRAEMHVSLTNHGPVTLILDSWDSIPRDK